MVNYPDIPSFFAGRSIFITGGSGFMGKVLVERLLTTCPDIGCLYLLMREKKKLCPEERLMQLKQNKVFDVLRASYPHQLDKIQIISGDATLPNLGITANGRALMKNVSIVIHCAATVKFNEELKNAVNQNLRSVIRLLKLCDTLTNIDACIHVSTVFSNSELSIIEERVYSPPMDLDKLLDLVDNRELGAEEVKMIIGSKPNTYTFTKAMAEHAVEQHGCKRYPIAIFRPSGVVSAHRHPFPGWIENFNGPSGAVAGVSSGLLRVIRCSETKRAEIVPVDITIDSLIAVAWETAVDKLNRVRVYNCSSIKHPTTWGCLQKVLNRTLPLYPSINAIMYPHLVVAENWYIYKILDIILQTIPLHLVHYMSRIVGVKSLNLIKGNQKLHAMNTMFEYFSLREWEFKNDNMVNLRHRLSKEDQSLFNLDVRSVNWDQFYVDFIKGVRKFVLKEPETQLNKARTRMRRINLITTVIKVSIPFLIFILISQYVMSEWNI